ncbi:MAG: arylsulfatase [Opitutales bacterium]|nr:arylsulfatase [Opitutales bacterium]
MKKTYSLLLTFSLIAVVLAGCGKCGTCTSDVAKGDPSKPNVIYILADDMGYGDLSFLGQTAFSTANIDKMATEGLVMTQHYTGSTVCAPSRAALMTGKHTGHTSVRGNAPAQLLLDEEVTIAEVFKSAGYKTGAIGKWGIGHPPEPSDPHRNGFDHFYGYINMWHAHNFYPEFLYRNGEKVKIPGNKLMDVEFDSLDETREGAGVAEIKETYAHDLFDQEALEFIEDNKDNPFFLYMAYNVPHANNEAGYLLGDGMEVKDYGRFADKDWPNPEKGFAKMMENLDNSVGIIVEKLEELGLTENTIVVFSTDNGPHEEGGHVMEFFNSNGDLRGQKRDLYDGGVKTPMIIKWPAKIKAGSSTDHISAFWDFLPTMADLLDVDAPEGIDGISMLPSWLGNDEEQEAHDYLYWEFYELGGRQAVLQGEYKAVRLNVRTGKPSPTELYHLPTDPDENDNLADMMPEKALEMEELMNEAHEPLSFMSLFEGSVDAETRF